MNVSLQNRRSSIRNKTASSWEVSEIFKWFAEDFEKGNKGLRQVGDLFARYAAPIAPDAAAQASIRNKTVAITYLPYDWSLNDAQSTASTCIIGDTDAGGFESDDRRTKHCRAGHCVEDLQGRNFIDALCPRHQCEIEYVR